MNQSKLIEQLEVQIKTVNDTIKKISSLGLTVRVYQNDSPRYHEKRSTGLDVQVYKIDTETLLNYRSDGLNPMIF